MKRLWKLGSALILAGFMAIGNFGSTIDTVMAADFVENSIMVNGKGTVKVEPDIATIYMGVTTSEKDAKTAQEKNADAMKKVLDKLKAMGIKESQIVTSDYSIYPEYSYKDNGDRDTKGYTARNMIQVTTSDVKNTAAIIDGVTAAGANINNGVSFSVKDPSKYYSEALRLAADNARISATSIANSMNVTLGSPIFVNENSDGYSYSVMSYSNGSNQNKEMMSAERDINGGGGTSISYDKIEITARISAVYKYVN